jgi:hypothetical protein
MGFFFLPNSFLTMDIWSVDMKLESLSTLGVCEQKKAEKKSSLIKNERKKKKPQKRVDMTRRKQRGKSRRVCCVAVDTGKTAATIYEQLISIKERARREGRKENAVRKLPIEKKKKKGG